jgi:hypothetical protein
MTLHRFVILWKPFSSRMTGNSTPPSRIWSQRGHRKDTSELRRSWLVWLQTVYETSPYIPRSLINDSSLSGSCVEGNSELENVIHHMCLPYFYVTVPPFSTIFLHRKLSSMFSLKGLFFYLGNTLKGLGTRSSLSLSNPVTLSSIYHSIYRFVIHWKPFSSRMTSNSTPPSRIWSQRV